MILLIRKLLGKTAIVKIKITIENTVIIVTNKQYRK